MKAITILIITITLNACGNAKEASAVAQEPEVATTKKNTKDTNMVKESQETTLQIEYTAISRGTYKHLSVINEKIDVKKSHADKGTSVNCKKNEWTKIVSLSNAIVLESISELKSPTNASHYDGALSATLAITKDGKTYQSSSFDHGNPPKEIEPLVTYILSLAKVE